MRPCALVLGASLFVLFSSGRDAMAQSSTLPPLPQSAPVAVAPQAPPAVASTAHPKEGCYTCCEPCTDCPKCACAEGTCTKRSPIEGTGVMGVRGALMTEKGSGSDNTTG
ncbi:MAG: hypothetical protein ABIP89_06775, partial [Polyangiaceae bacterium]